MKTEGPSPEWVERAANALEGLEYMRTVLAMNGVIEPEQFRRRIDVALDVTHKLNAELLSQRAEIERLLNAIRYAYGLEVEGAEPMDGPAVRDGRPRYWWRREMLKLAGVTGEELVADETLLAAARDELHAKAMKGERVTETKP